jgi:hypothetical protein
MVLLSDTFFTLADLIILQEILQFLLDAIPTSRNTNCYGTNGTTIPAVDPDHLMP